MSTNKPKTNPRAPKRPLTIGRCSGSALGKCRARTIQPTPNASPMTRPTAKAHLPVKVQIPNKRHRVTKVHRPTTTSSSSAPYPRGSDSTPGLPEGRSYYLAARTTSPLVPPNRSYSPKGIRRARCDPCAMRSALAP